MKDKPSDEPPARQTQQEVNKQIGARVREVRQWSNLTQADVARGLGISRGRWSMYESGRRSLTVLVMINFCKLASADPAYLLLGRRPRQPRMILDKQRAAEAANTADDTNGGG